MSLISNIKTKFNQIKPFRKLNVPEKPKFRSIGDPVVKSSKSKRFIKSNIRQRRFRF